MAIIFPSAARPASVNSNDIRTPRNAKGVRLYLDITANSGTAETLDIKLQMKDTLTGNYHDMTGAAFAQKTATGTDELVIYPSIGETANKAVSDVLTRTWRLVYTLGGSATPTFTFQVNAEYLL